MLEEMFENWRQRTYFDNEEHVFPSEELLDELQIHDTVTRKYVAKVFNDLVVDFNSLLLEYNIYDYFCSMGYSQIKVYNDSALFT